MDLNPRQRDAVRYIDGPVLVLASVGSARTPLPAFMYSTMTMEGWLRWER